MPTVDARPQHPNWISTMKGADAIFTYSDWAKDELLKYKSINVVGVCASWSRPRCFQARFR